VALVVVDSKIITINKDLIKIIQKNIITIKTKISKEEYNDLFLKFLS